MKIYLARHGEAELLDTDPGLSDRGKQQATELAQMLKAKTISIPTIYHSGKQRTLETAEIIANFMSPKPKVKEKAGSKLKTRIDIYSEIVKNLETSNLSEEKKKLRQELEKTF